MVELKKKNMSLKKVLMPEQDPKVRGKNFREVALGYTEEMAVEEAKRCLNCKHKPCMKGCPVMVRIPEFIEKVLERNFEEAYRIITATNNLPAVCGRVCPQENQCEKYCVRAIKGESVGIGRLERFVADWHMLNGDKSLEPVNKNGRKIAVVGAGPAGLTCAGDLAKKGYDVTIFESLHLAGGVLMYGIPEFRLPKNLVQKEIQTLIDMGVKIETNTLVGASVSLDELLQDEGFDACFIGSGAGLPSFMGIPGENLNAVYSANEFLTRINLMRAYDRDDSDTPIHIGKRVAVVGGGNVAMDAARSALRLGAEKVYIIYRRGEDELPARKEEIHHAKEEGIEFKLLNNPTRIIGDERGWVRGLELIRMELTDADESGRRRPKPLQGSEYVLAVDSVIVAIGQSPNPLLRQTTPDLKCAPWGGIIVDDRTGKTSKGSVYAGGDAVTGAATVILAAGSGKVAAESIHKALSESIID